MNEFIVKKDSWHYKMFEWSLRVPFDDNDTSEYFLYHVNRKATDFCSYSRRIITFHGFTFLFYSIAAYLWYMGFSIAPLAVGITLLTLISIAAFVILAVVLFIIVSNKMREARYNSYHKTSNKNDSFIGAYIYKLKNRVCFKVKIED